MRRLGTEEVSCKRRRARARALVTNLVVARCLCGQWTLDMNDSIIRPEMSETRHEWSECVIPIQNVPRKSATRPFSPAEPTSKSVCPPRARARARPGRSRCGIESAQNAPGRPPGSEQSDRSPRAEQSRAEQSKAEQSRVRGRRDENREERRGGDGRLE